MIEELSHHLPLQPALLPEQEHIQIQKRRKPNPKKEANRFVNASLLNTAFCYNMHSEIKVKNK